MSRQVNLISPCDISREGIARILSSEGFSVHASFDSIANAAFEEVADGAVFLVDYPDAARHAAAVESLVSRFETAIVIILTPEFDLKVMLECFDAGARGYIIKSYKSAPIIAAIRLAVSGERVLPQEVLSIFEGNSKLATPFPDVANETEEANLSPREHDVLCCLMAGYSNKAIARELDVCEATVKVHVKAILRKLNVNNRTQAAIWANSHSYTASHTPYQSQRLGRTAQAL